MVTSIFIMSFLIPFVPIDIVLFVVRSLREKIAIA